MPARETRETRGLPWSVRKKSHGLLGVKVGVQPRPGARPASHNAASALDLYVTAVVEWPMRGKS